jgi:hypothetical protein
VKDRLIVSPAISHDCLVVQVSGMRQGNSNRSFHSCSHLACSYFTYCHLRHASATPEILRHAERLVQTLSAIIVPYDIGRVNPPMATWVKIGTEKMAMKPQERAELDVGLHYPRLGSLKRLWTEENCITTDAINKMKNSLSLSSYDYTLILCLQSAKSSTEFACRPSNGYFFAFLSIETSGGIS